MSRGEGATLGFELEYFDPIPNSRKTIWMKLYVEDGTIELREETRVYLKRIKYPGITIDDMFVGNSVNIYNKVMVVRSYCNSATQKYMDSRESHFLCVASDVRTLTQLLEFSNDYSLRLGRVKTIPQAIEEFSISAGDIAIELVGLSGKRSNQFLSDISAIPVANSSVLLTDYASISKVMTLAAAPTPQPTYCTLAVIKPHVVASPLLPALLKDILDAGFDVISISSLHFNVSMAEELLEAYKEVTPKYGEMLAHMASGKSLALLLAGFKEDTVAEFRKLCGPYLPDVAKALRPDSLRGKYGIEASSATLNAVHCSDLDEYGPPECKYIFDTVLQLDL